MPGSEKQASMVKITSRIEPILEATTASKLRNKKMQIELKFMEQTDLSDRELLEFAAKAAGILYLVPYKEEWLASKDAWNPLNDDGDAFRLLVKLGFNIEINGWGEGSPYLISVVKNTIPIGVYGIYLLVRIQMQQLVEQLYWLPLP
jgi:hypothetical protein